MSSSSFSALQSDFQTGDYTFDLGGGIKPTANFTINYVGNTYAVNPPELTAASFNALQGMNAAAGVTLDFNSFITSGDPNHSDITFSVLDSSNNSVFFSGFLDSYATDVTIPTESCRLGSPTLSTFCLSEPVFGENDSPAFGTTQFYDTHTAGAFFTEAGAVPEPSTWAMLLIGIRRVGRFADTAALGSRAWRRPPPEASDAPTGTGPPDWQLLRLCGEGRPVGSTPETMFIAVSRAHKLSVTLLHLACEPVMGLVWGRRRYAPMIKHDYRPAKNKPVTADRSRSGGWAGGRKA